MRPKITCGLNAEGENEEGGMEREKREGTREGRMKGKIIVTDVGGKVWRGK